MGKKRYPYQLTYWASPKEELLSHQRQLEKYGGREGIEFKYRKKKIPKEGGDERGMVMGYALFNLKNY